MYCALGGGCNKVEKIVIPESVKYINDTQYKDTCSKALENSIIEIKTKRLDGISISTLLMAYLEFDQRAYRKEHSKNLIEMLNRITKQLPEQISVKDNMCITNDGVLLKYTGKEKQVKISENVRVIGAKAFANCTKLEEVELSNDIISIGIKHLFFVIN